MAAASTPPPPPSADAPAPRAKKTALDYMLGGNSVKTNGYLAAFASNAPLLRALRSDEAYASIIRTHGLKKEITEASAALNRVKRCIERLTSHDTSAGGAKRKDGAGLCFVDLCSGKGFLSMLLAWEFPKAKVLQVDNDDNLTRLDHLTSLPTITFHREDIYSENAQKLVSDAVRDAACEACVVLGVHLCGELSRRAVTLWRNSGAHALVLAPCCLPRRRRHDAFGFHVKDQARAMKVPSYQLWCTMLYGLLPRESHHCEMCADDDVVGPFGTFVCATRKGAAGVDAGRAEGAVRRGIRAGREASKWVILRDG